MTGAPACQRSRCCTRRRHSPQPPTRARSRPTHPRRHDRGSAQLGQTSDHSAAGPPSAGRREGDVDERWYWAAPLMLDAHADWWAHPDLAAEWTGRDKRASAQESRWQEHVELARSAADGTLDPALGPAPGATSRRARPACGRRPRDARTTSTHARHGPSDRSLDARLPAAQVAWALRGLFNAPEATALLRAARASREDTYWREVMRHCIDGCLQAVLDEHAHVLMESEGCNEPAGGEGSLHHRRRDGPSPRAPRLARQLQPPCRH